MLSRLVRLRQSSRSLLDWRCCMPLEFIIITVAMLGIFWLLSRGAREGAKAQIAKREGAGRREQCGHAVWFFLGTLSALMAMP